METHAELNFKTLFASMPGLYVVYSLEFTIVDGSDAYFHTVKAEKASVLGCNVFELLNQGCDRNSPLKEDLIPTQALKASLQQVIASSQPHTLSYTIESSKKGDPSTGLAWLSVHSPVFDSNDRLTHILRKIEDLTASTRTLHALQETVQQLSAIYDGSSRFVGLITPDGSLVKTNRASLEFANSQLEDVIGKPYWDTVWFQHTPNAPEQVRQSVQRAFKGESVRYDSPIITPTGEVKTYELSFHPIRNEAGEVTFVMPEATDITARVLAQAALRDSEERFRALADNIAQFAWIADATGNVFWYNQRWSDYTGLTLKESVSAGWQQVHHPDYIKRTTEKFNFHIQQGEPWEDTFPLRNKAGQYRWFLSRAVPIYDEHSKVSRWFGTNTDITEQLQAEKEKEQLLEREQQARIAAESANRTKDEFLAVVSHELRTPLNSILGWSQILQKKKLPSKLAARALGTIEQNAKAQAQLIDDLLDVSRILQGKLRLKAGAVSLTNAIQSAVDNIQLSAEAKSITLHTTLDEAVGTLSGDADRLQQIVWNLLSNAIKFTPQGGRVEVELKQAGEAAQITVSDTGKGIHPEFLPLVFEHFRQQDASITRRFGGLGLGLAIVRDLVELHGGTIDVDSAGEGKGTTFKVLLPLK